MTTEHAVTTHGGGLVQFLVTVERGGTTTTAAYMSNVVVDLVPFYASSLDDARRTIRSAMVDA